MTARPQVKRVAPVLAQTRAQAAQRGATLELDLLAFDAALAPATKHAFGRTFICPVRVGNMQHLLIIVTQAVHTVLQEVVCPAVCRTAAWLGFGEKLHSIQCWAMPVN
jgi:hypothetical protein